jgi:hypothetical protein
MSTEPPSPNPLFQIASGDGNAPEKPPDVPVDARAELVRLLDASEDKHFVFFFGSPAAGKTAILGSVIQAMQRPEVQGRLFVHGAGDGYFKHGLALWDQIRRAFDQKQFPTRTKVGGTIQLHAQYKPPGNGTPMDLIFLEMAGEDLKKVMITDKGGRSLPFHIGQFLRLPQLKVAFIVTTPWQDATRDDAMIDDFLSYVNETAPHLIESRIILLVTKWDTFPNAATMPIEQFVQLKMPRTSNKISAKRNIIQPFSVGKIIPFEGDAGDIIASFDYAAGQRLFASIYETFTGITVGKPKKRFWEF